jgi:putative transposase
VMLVMDVFTRRIIGFGIAPACIDGVSVCMFNCATAGRPKPKYLSTDHDRLFPFHRWLANLRVLEVEEIKSVPYAPEMGVTRQRRGHRCQIEEICVRHGSARRT